MELEHVFTLLPLNFYFEQLFELFSGSLGLAKVSLKTGGECGWNFAQRIIIIIYIAVEVVQLAAFRLKPGAGLLAVDEVIRLSREPQATVHGRSVRPVELPRRVADVVRRQREIRVN